MVRPQYDQIARAIEMMAMAMQQQSAHFAQMKAGRAAAEAARAVAEAARPVVSQDERDLAEFRGCQPPQFKGDADPDVADQWLSEMEKIFSVLGSSEERKLAYAVYMMGGEAEYWWRGTRQMLESRGVLIDWDCFRRVFLEKYFPDSVRYAKEAEFMRLHQGSLSIFEYAMRFEHLALEFPALVEKAKTVERLEGGGSSGKAARVQEGSSGSRKGGQQRGPYDRLVQSQRVAVSKGPRPTTPQGGAQSVRCYRCGGAHVGRDCSHPGNVCFRCDYARRDLVLPQLEDWVVLSVGQAK
ncbi:uncharacterized protein LOC109818739 [Cajanus cajan]|uniref:uncharacterized protein LOC109818739 n=1 Tax=Cajanus cajan TaxID=3821 RepID=UPI00098D79AB|nr:uncharacterized protein LOC109818739 [Cajanus cajan]